MEGELCWVMCISWRMCLLAGCGGFGCVWVMLMGVMPLIGLMDEERRVVCHNGLNIELNFRFRCLKGAELSLMKRVDKRWSVVPHTQP